MKPSERLLLTAFGPFADIKDNPSARLAAMTGRPHTVLEVIYEAVDAFVESLDPESFDVWLMLGVASKAETMRIEHVAHNSIVPLPDADGAVHGPGPIDPRLPSQLAATLWPGLGMTGEGPSVAPSADAGGYLCNYAFFRAAARFPDKLVGFLHVAPPEAVALDQQFEEIAAILTRIDAGPEETR